MWNSLWWSLLTFQIARRAFAFPAPPGYVGRWFKPTHPTLGQAQEFDETDLSFITNLAAIGDSYSAGIGAGDRLGSVLQALDPKSDYACSRYNQAYPYLINNDPRLGDASTRDFQFLSCSGAVTTDVLKEQIPSLNSGQQAILLSVGGNDVELVNILNQCIYQWAVLNQAQVAVAQAAAQTKQYDWAKDYDWDKLGRGCQGQLDRTQSLIASSTFSSNIDAVLNAAKAKLAPGGMIYYVGYGKFFAEDLSPACDNVTWSTFIYKASNVFQSEEYLTKANRQRMNQLVDAVNAQLAAAVQRAGPMVQFVNYDSYIHEFGGRYCEAGVDEATTESNTRNRLMFYELNTWDPLGASPWKRSNGDPLQGTFEGDLDIYAEVTFLMDPAAKINQPAASQTDQTSNTLNNNKTIEGSSKEIQVPNLLPDGYGRVFHPQILLHNIIANLVIYEMTNLNQQNHGLPAIPENLAITVCPLEPALPTITTITSISTPDGSSCVRTATVDLCKTFGDPCGAMLTCGSWTATATAAPTLPPTSSIPPPPTTTAKPVNPPPPRTNCNRDSDCSKYTCPNGKAATCSDRSSGDPFTIYCGC